MSAIAHFNFQGDDLEIVTEDGRVLVGIRAICEGVGVDFSGQLQKLKADPSVGVEMISTPSKGGVQEVACIPLRALPLWLATIHPSKVKAAVREKVIAYRREAAEVLADYFLGPRVAPPPIPPARGRPLTAKQAAILDYMKAHARTFGAPPTYREIAAHFGLSSTNAVNDHLVCLEKKGAIVLRHNGRSRGVILPPEAPRPSPPAPAAPPPAADRIDRLERLVEQLVGAVALLAAPRPVPRKRLPPPGQPTLPFPDR